MKAFIKNLSLATLCTIFFWSCSSDDQPPIPVNEEEVITTLTVTLTPQIGGPVITLQSRDLDGDGPNAPVVTVSGDLEASTIYDGSVELLNETETPPENVTEEVVAEAEDHQFFFAVVGAAIAISYADQDSNGNPIGLSFKLITAGPSSGNLTVTLRHEADKNAAGVRDGDITNAGGETDVAQTFSVVVK